MTTASNRVFMSSLQPEIIRAPLRRKVLPRSGKCSPRNSVGQRPRGLGRLLAGKLLVGDFAHLQRGLVIIQKGT
jgi:hypothetical protein